MGGGVQSNFGSRGALDAGELAEERVDESGCRAFAFCAGDVNDIESVKVGSGITNAFEIFNHFGDGKVE